MNFIGRRLYGPSTVFHLPGSSIFVNAQGSVLGSSLPYNPDTAVGKDILGLVGNDEYEKLAKKRDADFSSVNCCYLCYGKVLLESCSCTLRR